MGIAVLNGVVLISYINEVVGKGELPFREAVMEGARRRLRPVMLTASIAALGLVPFLFASGPGAEIQRPLAIVVIGGLVTATALTLLLLPILYDRLALARPVRRRLDAHEKRLAPEDAAPAALAPHPPSQNQSCCKPREVSLEQSKNEIDLRFSGTETSNSSMPAGRWPFFWVW